MHRAEEGSKAPLALLIAQFAGNGIEPLVHQPIVAGHRPVVVHGIHARASLSSPRSCDEALGIARPKLPEPISDLEPRRLLTHPAMEDWPQRRIAFERPKPNPHRTGDRRSVAI